jgi:hypothetical protein
MGEVKQLRGKTMKVNFAHEFHDHRGNKVSNGGEKPATLLELSIDSLMYPSADELKGMSGKEKVKRHDLAMKILREKNETDMNVEDVAMLKKIIGDRYVPVVVAQAYAVLEGKEAPKYEAM